jgi:type I restriction enzyme R subunit
MDERAFSILRIMETMAPDHDDANLQATAIAVGALYAAAQAEQPSWFFMESYRKELKRHVRRILTEHGIPDAKAARDEIEEFAVHAYAGQQ